MIRVAVLIWLALAGAAAACERMEHRGRSFTVCTADLARQAIGLRLNGADGAPLGTFAALAAATPGRIAFAMNGGMYHPDRRPVGLYIEDGVQATPLLTGASRGNFGLLPNGLFCVQADRADAIETRAFVAAPRRCLQATQSGPMLVIDGELHPRFLRDSPSAKRRNGVGATEDGRIVHFVISDGVVTFHEMATLFRDVLGVRNALFLDGSISRVYDPAAGRSDAGRDMGPILVVTER